MFSALKKGVMIGVAAVFGALIIMFSLANRAVVELDLWPLGLTQEAPLYLLFLGALTVGVIWGGFAAWLSAGKARRRAREATRRAQSAEADVRHHEETIERLESELRDLRAIETSPPRLPPAADAA